MLIFPLTAKEGFTRSNITLAILYSIPALFCFMTFGVCVTLIASLKHRIATLMMENTNLFDKMHEGLIVVAKQNLTPSFSNKPAAALFKHEANLDRSIRKT